MAAQGHQRRARDQVHRVRIESSGEEDEDSSDSEDEAVKRARKAYATRTETPVYKDPSDDSRPPPPRPTPVYIRAKKKPPKSMKRDEDESPTAKPAAAAAAPTPSPDAERARMRRIDRIDFARIAGVEITLVLALFAVLVSSWFTDASAGWELGFSAVLGWHMICAMTQDPFPHILIVTPVFDLAVIAIESLRYYYNYDPQRQYAVIAELSLLCLLALLSIFRVALALPSMRLCRKDE